MRNVDYEVLKSHTVLIMHEVETGTLSFDLDSGSLLPIRLSSPRACQILGWEPKVK
jgi:hypothetical protein